MRGSMVDIQWPTAEIRRGNKKRRKKKKPQDENMYARILLCRVAIKQQYLLLPSPKWPIMCLVGR